MTLWMVGKIIDDPKWEIMGVFSTEEKACSICKDENYFIGPLNLDEVLPDETIEWRGAYYPNYPCEVKGESK